MKLKGISRPYAVTGFNGDDEINIGLSSQISLSFFNHHNHEIPVKNLVTPIDFYAARDPDIGQFQNLNFELFNTSILSDGRFQSNDLLTYQFLMNGQNNSLQIQFKPFDNASIYFIGYLFLFAFNGDPILNSTYSQYDFSKVFCPTGKICLCCSALTYKRFNVVSFSNDSRRHS